MPGQSITHHQMAALESLGEEHVFATYLELRSVKKLLETLGPTWTAWCQEHELATEHNRKFGLEPFYKWLDAGEGRRERWNRLRQDASEILADQVLDIANEVTDGTVRVAKVKSDNLKWWSQAHNPKYRPGGAQVQVNNVSFAEVWFEAVKNVQRQIDEERDRTLASGGE